MLAARRRLLQEEAVRARQVRRLYRRAAERLRSEIEGITAADSLRRRYLEVLRTAINRRVRELEDSLLALAQDGIRATARLPVDAAQQYMLDVLRDELKRAGIRAMFAEVHERAVIAMLGRTLHDGLRLSDRVWRLGQEVRRALAAIIEEAVAVGADPRRTARAVEQYLTRGGYWAEPLRDETRRRMRVPRNILHGALRLTVTELHHAYHEASVLAYQATPGVLGVEWRLSPSHVVPDVCDELAARGPYPVDQVPPKPHPWCRCYTVPAVEPPDQFVDRLREWLHNPASHPDIEGWYRRFEAQLRGTFRRSAPAVVTPPEVRFWDQPLVRRRLLWELEQALTSGDSAAVDAAIKAIDDQVVAALREAGLPRGDIAGVYVLADDEDPEIVNNYGYKHPGCWIVISRRLLQRVLAGKIDTDKILHTWIHESLHARRPFVESAEYGYAPGFEEGVVDWLARQLIHKLTGWKNPDRHPYDGYVYAMEGLARALGIEPEQFMRRLWKQPTGAVSAEVFAAVREHLGVDQLESWWRTWIENPFLREKMVVKPSPPEFWEKWFRESFEMFKSMAT